MLELLDSSEAVAVYFTEPTEISGKRVRLALDGLSAEVFEQVVVNVDAVERRLRRVCLVEVLEQVVDEMRKRF